MAIESFTSAGDQKSNICVLWLCLTLIAMVTSARSAPGTLGKHEVCIEDCTGVICLKMLKLITRCTTIISKSKADLDRKSIITGKPKSKPILRVGTLNYTTVNHTGALFERISNASRQLVPIRGYKIDVILEIGKRIGKQVIFFEPRDACFEYSSARPHEKCVINDLAEGTVDMTFFATQSYKRFLNYDVSAPLTFIDVSFVIREPAEEHQWTFWTFTVFTWLTWVLTLAIAVLQSVQYSLCCSFEGPNTPLSFTSRKKLVWNSVKLHLRAAIHTNHELPVPSRLRLSFGQWVLFIFFLSSIYRANMFPSFVVQPRVQPIDTFDELATVPGGYSYNILERSDTLLNLFKQSESDSLQWIANNTLPTSKKETVGEALMTCFQKALAEDHACISHEEDVQVWLHEFESSLQTQQVTNNQSNNQASNQTNNQADNQANHQADNQDNNQVNTRLRVSSVLSLPFVSGFLFPKGSPYIRPVDRVVHQLFSSGIYNRWKQMCLDDNYMTVKRGSCLAKCRTENVTSEVVGKAKSLTTEHFVAIGIIYASGLWASVLVFATEVILNRIVK